MEINFYEIKRLIKTLFSLFYFLTFYVLVLNILYHLNILKKYQTSIFLLTIIVSICGFCLTYINPKKYVVPVYNYEIKGHLKYLVDIVTHHIPLIILALKYDNNIKHDNLLLFFGVICVYLIFNNPIDVYHINL